LILASASILDPLTPDPLGAPAARGLLVIRRPLRGGPLQGVGPCVELRGPHLQLLFGGLGPRSSNQLAALSGKPPEEVSIHRPLPPSSHSTTKVQGARARLGSGPQAQDAGASFSRAAEEPRCALDLAIMEEKPVQLHHSLLRLVTELWLKSQSS